MATVRTIATHQVVQALFPRPPPTDDDDRAILAGRVIDATLSRASHEVRIGRRPTTASLLTFAGAEYDEGLAEADLPPGEGARTAMLEQVGAVLKAFRASPLYGLARPRSRWILVQEEVGMYAQPDFWDGSRRIFEMKSFRPEPLPPDVAVQLRCFQLAFPGFETLLVGLNRHVRPVETSVTRVAPPTADETTELLRNILRVGREKGVPKVSEYLGAPAAAYRVSES